VQKLFIWTVLLVAIAFSIISVFYVVGRNQYMEYQGLKLERRADSHVLSAAEIETLLEGFQNAFMYRTEDPVSTKLINNDFDVDDEILLEIELDKSGDFLLFCRVSYPEKTNTNGFLEVTVNGDDNHLILLDTLSYYDFEAKALDRYGNEIVPEQRIYDKPIYSYFKDAKRVSGEPVAFSMKAGINTLLIRNLRSSFHIDELYVLRDESFSETPDYEDYLRDSSYKDEQDIEDENIVIEAENLIGKSDLAVSIVNLQTPSVTPYEVLKKKVNVVSSSTFKYSGQMITWVAYVQKAGFYGLAFRYQQSENRGIPVFRRIYINGRIPFSEVAQYRFEPTDATWKDKVIAGEQGEPYYFYLNEGTNYISLEVTTGMYEDTITFLQRSVAQIQEIALDVRKLVGNNLDRNRTWNIEKYMPEVIRDLDAIADELEARSQSLIEVVGEKGRPSISELAVVADLIRRILKNSDRMPFYLDELSEGAASAVQRLSELSMRLKEQPLSLDKLYILAGEFKNFSSAASLAFVKAYEEIEKLRLSLLNKNEAYSIYEGSAPENLRIWVNRPVQYVETLQYLIDTDFTPKTGISVVLSVMQNEQRLILASSSGKTPDAALGISSWLPFELAIRNALYPLSAFDDFFDFASENMNIETLLPMVVEGEVYGITETQNFYVLFYRKDILESLGIPVPDTWDDVKMILPELQRRGMNFYIPLCEQTIKYFNTTAPFFFQNGARFYAKDGITTALNEENSVKAFELMTEIFSIFGLPEQVASFYNDFRYGRIPIGIGDFGLYVALSNAADEIYGLWDIAPSPGVQSSEGSVKRYQVAGDRASIIFSDSQNKEKTWLFLKWWLSKETQLKYARTLVTRYGQAYLWNTANIGAFREVEFFDEFHKRAILEQWRWIGEVQRHPGGYMVEREVSNVWNKVVIEGRPLRSSIDRSVILVNRELERKLTEFGYLIEGEKTRDYRIYETMEDFLIETLGREANEFIEKSRGLWGEGND
jgi:ABC-type glycerol-3-phosphate transport system substrate-binding protein